MIDADANKVCINDTYFTSFFGPFEVAEYKRLIVTNYGFRVAVVDRGGYYFGVKDNGRVYFCNCKSTM